MDHILSQIYAVHTLKPCFLKRNFYIILSHRLDFPSEPLPSDFPTKILYAILISILNTFPSLDLIILIIFDEEYKFT